MRCVLDMTFTALYVSSLCLVNISMQQIKYIVSNLTNFCEVIINGMNYSVHLFSRITCSERSINFYGTVNQIFSFLRRNFPSFSHRLGFYASGFHWKKFCISFVLCGVKAQVHLRLNLVAIWMTDNAYSI